jgi:hypothetical protein
VRTRACAPDDDADEPRARRREAARGVGRSWAADTAIELANARHELYNPTRGHSYERPRCRRRCVTVASQWTDHVVAFANINICCTYRPTTVDICRPTTPATLFEQWLDAHVYTRLLTLCSFRHPPPMASAWVPVTTPPSPKNRVWESTPVVG